MKEPTKTAIANGVTIGGTTIALMIANLPLWISSTILVGTVIGCVHLTNKEGK